MSATLVNRSLGKNPKRNREMRTSWLSEHRRGALQVSELAIEAVELNRCGQ